MITEESLIEEMLRLEEELGHPPREKDMRDLGKYSKRPYYDRFGSWNGALSACDLEQRYTVCSKEELLEDLSRFYRSLEETSSQVYEKEWDNYSVSTFENKFGSWNEAIQAAGIEPDNSSLYNSKGSILKELQDFYEEFETTSRGIYEEEWDGFSVSMVERRFGSWIEAWSQTEIEIDSVKCPDCTSHFHNLANHWNYNPSHRPDVSKKQHEIVTGLVMGDGSVGESHKNCSVSCTMITPPFLEWVDEEFGVLGTGVDFFMRGGESAEKAREYGFTTAVNDEEYHDTYSWSSRSHPEFNQYRDWYSTGEKRFPDDLELTPLTLKVWYCCDGTKRNNSIIISCSNEADRLGFVCDLFKEVGFNPSPMTTEREDMRHDIQLDIYFDVQQSEELWDWMGDPLPGFEYKWPSRFC